MADGRRRLDGRIAAVTGGASGIGEACVMALLGAGARVAILDANERNIADAKLRLSDMNVTFDRLDVTDFGAVEAMAAQLTERLGRIDILVNSAGIGRQTAAEDITAAEWREVIDINLSGTFYTAQAFGRRMLDGNGGAIVNIGSMAGDIVVRPQKNVHYNASKAAVHHLTRSMAAEWAPLKVRVNAVAPGFIETPMNAFALKEDVATTTMWLSNTPMGRVGQTDEIASVVLFLCSEASSLMTGAIVAADAGYSLW
jgi:NAD(P)-dependent dehydrogenase (short-subunit alcohol dehydrogenase family)